MQPQCLQPRQGHGFDFQRMHPDKMHCKLLWIKFNKCKFKIHSQLNNGMLTTCFCTTFCTTTLIHTMSASPPYMLFRTNYSSQVAFQLFLSP